MIVVTVLRFWFAASIAASLGWCAMCAQRDRHNKGNP